MKKVKSKTITLLLVIILLAINSGLLFSYYNFYLSDKIFSDLTSAKNQNYGNLYAISKTLEDKTLDEAIEEIELYTNEHGGYVSLKDDDGKVVYTNKKDLNKLFSSTMIVYIEDDEYELTYSRISILPGMRFIRNFIVYEIILVSTFVIIAFFISSKKLIDPIETITNDINDYKYGKRPFKRKMPKKMQKIQNTFVDMVDSLEIEKDYQNQIIASISHDIKTPLTSVIGYADRLKNNDLSYDKKINYVNKIYNKALLMKEILEEFDDYQSCNIKETLKLENVSIEKVCKSIKRDFEEELKDKKITLKINSSCNNKNVCVDIVKLKRVFSNIITNSVTHFKNKPGVINIDIQYKKGKIRFEVLDNAGGIPNEDDLKKIFEPLYTTDPSRKISGLGLSICKQIISSHDGMIYAKNNSIGGQSIIFVLPSV
jgi:signal transduction histidine kinase